MESSNDMKLDQKKTINRLVIYFFYDADGIVDRYVPYMLEDINKNCSELFVVCNGKLTPEGRKTFQKLTPNVRFGRTRALTSGLIRRLWSITAGTSWRNMMKS